MFQHRPEIIVSRSLPSEYEISSHAENYFLKPESMFYTKNNIYNSADIDFSSQIFFSVPTSEKYGENNCGQISSKNEILSVYSNVYSVSSTSLPALIAAPPKSDGFRRSHRHSIPGHRLSNYLKFLNELSAKGSSTVHLFSTAVISGSSSAPNLKEMPRPGEFHSKFYAIEIRYK